MPALKETSGNPLGKLQMIEYTGFIYCPKCSAKALEKYYTNGFRCKECHFVYFHNTASATGAIIFSRKGILLVKRAQPPKKGFLDVPGGFVNYGEPLESALKREVREELRVDITDWKYLGSFPNTYLYETVTYHTVDVFYICHYDESQSLLPNKEIEDIVWVTDIDSLQMDLVAFDSTKAALSLVKNHR
jgi:ADP-ribose pyrophosphatase YjhB (NUDIX family)